MFGCYCTDAFSCTAACSLVVCLCRFASTHTGKYQVAVPDAGAFYPSSNWMDDVAFNALWLHLATGEAKYKAEGLAWYLKHYSQEDGKGVWNNFDWDSNSWGAALLLTRCPRHSHKRVVHSAELFVAVAPVCDTVIPVIPGGSDMQPRSCHLPSAATVDADMTSFVCVCSCVGCRMFPNNPVPAERLATFVNAWTKGVDGVTYTPKGLAYSGVHANCLVIPLLTQQNNLQAPSYNSTSSVLFYYGIDWHAVHWLQFQTGSTRACAFLHTASAWQQSALYVLTAVCAVLHLLSHLHAVLHLS